ncbi:MULTISPECIES: NUDIX domain-containing protein [Sporosarcina]|uniref:NUDIX domain-containing protein n=1 Tax=Sporosarcina TaxID=1569 RepID=UPI00129B6A4F|nr:MULTISPECIES: NUDIX hydrolase [Sporosarcina]GKV66508.1 ADP-ribose pyrophosphatase [Sporosarcina sp. NCCP-2331]GLB56785.1 ADP-ribose pyrophosphatase [Sporosarcina sp. NCCP-2378]
MSKFTSEEEVLKNYDSSQYKTPDGYTSDIAIFTLVPNDLAGEEKIVSVHSLALMLIKRASVDADGEINIEGGKWALPGGFIHPEETAYEAAKRELEEETGVSGIHIEHYGVYDKLGRDKRGWIISNAHYAIVPNEKVDSRKAADDADDVQLFTIDEVFTLDLAFDHQYVIQDALEAVRKDVFQTTVVKNFLPNEFKLEELRQVLLAIIDDPVVRSKPGFFRKAPSLPFIAEALDSNQVPKTAEPTSTTKRPTKLYRFVEADITPSIWR